MHFTPIQTSYEEAQNNIAIVLQLQKVSRAWSVVEKFECFPPLSPQYSILGTEGPPTLKVHSFYWQLWFDWESLAGQHSSPMSANIRKTENICMERLDFFL